MKARFFVIAICMAVLQGCCNLTSANRSSATAGCKMSYFSSFEKNHSAQDGIFTIKEH